MKQNDPHDQGQSLSSDESEQAKADGIKDFQEQESQPDQYLILLKLILFLTVLLIAGIFCMGIVAITFR